MILKDGLKETRLELDDYVEVCGSSLSARATRPVLRRDIVAGGKAQIKRCLGKRINRIW